MLYTKLSCIFVTNLNSVTLSIQTLQSAADTITWLLQSLWQFQTSVRWGNPLFCCIPNRTGLPGTVAADAATREAVSHEILQSELALSSDIYVHLCCPLYHPCKMNGPLHRSTNCRQWSHPLRCGRPPSGRRRFCLCSFKIGTLFWCMVICYEVTCVHCDRPLTGSHSILLECPHYGKHRPTFHLQGILCHVFVDVHSMVSNVVAFLHSARVAKLI
jgi:hypothetical protein